MKRLVVLLAAVFLLVPAFVRAAENVPADVVRKYELVPKGVVLEGSADGIEEIKNISYNREANEFLINGTAKYKNPVTRKEFVSVLKSLIKDDRMGVTLLNGEPRFYGDISGSSDLTSALIQTDKILGGIVYGIDHLLEGIKLPGDYKPKKSEKRTIPVVAFSVLSRYTFAKENNVYQKTGCALDVNLIPLSEKKTATGGHLPDDEALKGYSMEESDRENIDQIRSHQSEYFAMPQFAKTVALGEAAAFARVVRDSGVAQEDLIKQMK